MILEEVHIKNFRSHEDTRVHFDEGISVIVGENGSGKTSILDAMNYALFKQKPNKDINIDDLIRLGSEETEISLKFNQNGRKFKVKRNRRKGRAKGSTLYRIVNDKEILERQGEDEITKEIEDILGVTGELFTSAIYIRQGEIDGLITATPASRKEMVGRLLGAWELETAHRNMHEIIREYKNKAERLRYVSDELKKTRERITEKREEIRRLESELKTINAALDTTASAVEKKEKEVKRIEAVKDLETKKRERAAELAHVQENIRKIEEYEKVIKDTAPAARRYVWLENEIQSLAKDWSQLTKLKERESNLFRELDTTGRRCDTLSQSIAQAFEKHSQIFKTSIKDFQTLEMLKNTSLKELESKEKELGLEKERILHRRSWLESQNRETEKAVKELEGASNKCPVCKNPLTPDHRKDLIDEYTSRMEKNTEELSEIGSSIKDIARTEIELNTQLKAVRGINLEVIENSIKELDAARHRYDEAKTELDKNKKDLEALADLETLRLEKEKEKQSHKNDNERHIEARGFLRKNLPEKDGFIKKADACIQEIEKIKKEIEDIGYAAGDLTEARLELKKLEEKLQLLREKKTKSKYGIQVNKQAIKERDNERVRLQEKKKEKQKLEKFAVFLNKVRKMFHKDRLQKELRASSRPIVERYTREVFDRFNLPYSDIKLTDDFGMIVYGVDGEKSVDMLSGGERIAAALALRIGIAKAISGSTMELIMLDEPTVHLDSQRRMDLVEIIKKLSTIPQTIVVTHDKEFENAADVLITVEKVDGISKVRYEGE